MNFLELIAAALDREGIESRISGEALYVPISPDVDLRCEEINSDIPAANVYVAVANAALGDDASDDDAMLVTAVFTVEDAVDTVNFHVATDQAVTIIRDLLDGSDARIADLDFEQDDEDPTLLSADVGESSSLEVVTTVDSSSPSVSVAFVTYIDPDDADDSDDTEDADESDESDDAEDADDSADIDDSDDIDPDASENDDDLRDDDVAVEVMDLGVFKDYDTVFNVLSVAVDQAENWEAELINSANDPWGNNARDPWVNET
ncbi:hypothetical protein L3H50_01645 [Corynebacterium sp. MC-04]|uniref:DNA primase n=2 Tax=Corynebacterium parakroppenstedtii TaxID=2828363 RepID=A0ABS9HIZ3_9CORY|nr:MULTISPECIES: hypothetical protein [Corynebacterium]KXB51127.1 hypothetical protein HMPREF1861_00160 [Corynebacterium kroppenstedtii]MBY0788042.1 hypothetical protein [Corynebacterium parakroppenstedtii]MBY0792117.1 hypothetical protein [Corynebacterium parakroppenstedtii]MCF6769066.1 hypothetical protein [Corynebacterium parakroppenstedtii]MCF6771074.1 hypothetical protein [Corynebacterium parakroppenstedtii]